MLSKTGGDVVKQDESCNYVVQRYFRTYESITYKYFFYVAYAHRANKLYKLFSCTATVISILSVLIWSISKSAPALWAVLIAAAQFAQVYTVNLPYAEQIASLKYLLPELNKLLCQIDKDWLLIGVNVDDCGKTYSPQRIVEMISGYERDLADLENQFAPDGLFPEIKLLCQKAEDDKDAYFNSRYTLDYEERSEPENVEQHAN